MSSELDLIRTTQKPPTRSSVSAGEEFKLVGFPGVAFSLGSMVSGQLVQIYEFNPEDPETFGVAMAVWGDTPVEDPNDLFNYAEGVHDNLLRAIMQRTT